MGGLLNPHRQKGTGGHRSFVRGPSRTEMLLGIPALLYVLGAFVLGLADITSAKAYRLKLAQLVIDPN